MQLLYELLKDPGFLVILTVYVAGTVVIVWILRRTHQPPIGPPSAEKFTKIILDIGRGKYFSWKLKIWLLICRWWRRTFRKERFLDSLTKCQVREFTSGGWCLGWAGTVPEITNVISPEFPGQWLFGFSGWIQANAIFRGSVVGHELLHAAQDISWGGQLFRPLIALRWYQSAFIKCWVETEALLFGSPLILLMTLGISSLFPTCVVFILFTLHELIASS